MNDRGQIMIIFALVIATIVISLSVLYTQNLLAGLETTKTMFAYPKEEIRNLEEIADDSILRNNYTLILPQIKVFCGEKGYVCTIIRTVDGKYYVKFVSKEVDYEGLED